MHDMNPEAWKDFYVATAGAAAALEGLVFVALSINLNRILAIPGGLVSIPGQSSRALGVELAIVSLAAWSLPVALHIAAGRGRYYQKRWQFLERVLIHQAATIPLLISSALLLCGGLTPCTGSPWEFSWRSLAGQTSRVAWQTSRVACHF